MTERQTQAGQDLLESFATHCAEKPEATAVVDGQEKWNYARLDAEATQYASILVDHGVGRESVVPVVASRSGQYIAMLLGVLRSGAAFLPLDPNTPPQRARKMCTDADAHVLFVQPGNETYAAELTDDPRQIVSVAARADHATAVFPHRDPAGLGYVIFTSGSTGTPKGAMVSDQGLSNHTSAKIGDLAIKRSDVIGFTAPLSFDISVWQALTALTIGGCVAVASPIDMSEPAELLAWIRRHGVTVLELVPSLLAVLLDEPALEQEPTGALSTLRCLVATGEALPLELAQRWHSSFPEITLINAYGPAECSDDVTHHVVTAAECAAGRPPSIGREIINTRIYLVDSAGREVVPGEEGEILVGGTGVGRGYIGDPARTATAFVPDHLSGTPGARLYRTGDRGRRATDGTIDFLGRRDRQIKIRGQRVELGDVEAHLQQISGVAYAAAVFVQKRLHAFISPQPGLAITPDSDSVLAGMRAGAQAFLVPHTVTVLDKLPTNNSGKVDHEALARRATETTQETSAGEDTDFLDAVQATMAEVLGVPEVALDDDFFAAGGDSLLGMKLVSVVRERFDVPDVSLRAFLAEPTLRGLLTALTTAKQTASDGLPDPEGEIATFALSSGQERLWFLEQLHPSRYAQLIRFQLVFHGALNLPALEHALAAVMRRHEPLRTVFSQERGVPSARTAPHAEILLRKPVEGDEPDPRRLTVDGLSARKEQPPLLVAHLVQQTPDRFVLGLVLHHLIADGVSLGVLGEEIGHYYERYLSGDTEVPLPSTTYSQYVAQERNWLAGPEAAEHEEFWRNHLSGADTLLGLPLDRPRPTSPEFTARSVVRTLTSAETAGVKEASRAERATPIMAVTSALYAVLRTLTETNDVVIGIDAANRSWPGSEELIGTFVNQLPMRLRSAPGPRPFSELLALVRRQSLAVYAHDRLPFHKIVAAVNPPRRSDRFPLFQVKVTHQGTWRDSLALPGIDVIPTVLSEPVTDLDLMLDVSEETDRLRLELVYRPELLDDETAATWLDSLHHALCSGAADTAAPLVVQFPTATANESTAFLGGVGEPPHGVHRDGSDNGAVRATESGID